MFWLMDPVEEKPGQIGFLHPQPSATSLIAASLGEPGENYIKYSSEFLSKISSNKLINIST